MSRHEYDQSLLMSVKLFFNFSHEAFVAVSQLWDSFSFQLNFLLCMSIIQSFHTAVPVCLFFVRDITYIYIQRFWGMVSNLLLSPLFLTVCPPGTYKPEGTPGGLSTCLSCPDLQHTSQPGSTSLSDCVCKPGYQQIGMTCQGKRNSSINWLTGPAPKLLQLLFIVNWLNTVVIQLVFSPWKMYLCYLKCFVLLFWLQQESCFWAEQ